MKTLKLLLVVLLAVGISRPAAGGSSLKEQNEALFAQIQRVHGLTDKQMQTIRAIFAASGVIGQGNPAITEHPATPQECEEKLSERKVRYENPEFKRICGADHMAPLYDPATEKPENAKVCIDQFEFPDIPVPIPWSGCGRARPHRYVPPWANASVTLMNGRAPAPAGSNHRITALTWLAESAPTRGFAVCGRRTTRLTKKAKPGATARNIARESAGPPASKPRAVRAATGPNAGQIRIRPVSSRIARAPCRSTI